MPKEDKGALLQDPGTADPEIYQCYTEDDFRRLEMVQRRADYILTSSVTPMLQQLQWPILQECRAQANVFMMNRIVCNLVDTPASYLTPTISYVSVRDHNMEFLVPYARTLVYQRSFFSDTIRIWNNLPQPVVSCPTLDSFSGEFQTIYFS